MVTWDQGSVRLQGSGLCVVTGIRPLFGYRDQASVRLQGAGLCMVTTIRTLYHVYGYESRTLYDYREQDSV